jgi:hypothetical protein
MGEALEVHHVGLELQPEPAVPATHVDVLDAEGARPGLGADPFGDLRRDGLGAHGRTA